jgi:hypothetical protein
MLHRIFKCTKCSAGIRLFDPELSSAFEFVKVDPGSAELIIVCNRCEHAAKYVMPGHPQAASQLDDVDCNYECTLECGSRCGARIPLFWQSNSGMTDEEINARIAHIVWQEIRCWNGHEIRHPYGNKRMAAKA